MQRQKPSLSEKLSSVWINTYSIDNYDPVSKKLNGKVLSSDYIPESYAIGFRKSKLVKALSFAGFRIQWRGRDELTLTNFIKDMIGWHKEGASTARKALNCLAPIAFLFNLAAVPFKFLLNLAKVFTEVLPGMGYKACKDKEKNSNNTAAVKVGWAALKYFFYGIRYVGRAITSPINNMRYEYKYGVKNEGSPIKGILRAVPSALMTIAFGVFALPYVAIKAAFTLLPLAAGKFSPVIVNTLGSAMNAAPSMFGAIGQFLAPVMAPVFKFLGVFSVHPVISGLGAVIAASIPTLGTAIDRGWAKLKNWCMPKTAKAVLVRVPIQESGQVEKRIVPKITQATVNNEVKATAKKEKEKERIHRTKQIIEELFAPNSEYNATEPVFSKDNNKKIQEVINEMRKNNSLSSIKIENIVKAAVLDVLSNNNNINNITEDVVKAAVLKASGSPNVTKFGLYGSTKVVTPQKPNRSSSPSLSSSESE